MVGLKNIPLWQILPLIVSMFLLGSTYSCSKEVQYVEVPSPVTVIPTFTQTATAEPTQTPLPLIDQDEISKIVEATVQARISVELTVEAWAKDNRVKTLPTKIPPPIPTPFRPIFVPTKIPTVIPTPTPRKLELMPINDFANIVSKDNIGTGQTWSMIVPVDWTTNLYGVLAPKEDLLGSYPSLNPDNEEDLNKILSARTGPVPNFTGEHCEDSFNYVHKTVSFECYFFTDLRGILQMMELVGADVPGEYVGWVEKYWHAIPQVRSWIIAAQSKNVDFNATLWLSKLFQVAAINSEMYVVEMPNVGGYSGYWQQPIAVTTEFYDPGKSVTFHVEEFKPYLPVEPFPDSCCTEDKKALREPLDIPTYHIATSNLSSRAYIDGYKFKSADLREINGMEMLEIKQEFTEIGGLWQRWCNRADIGWDIDMIGECEKSPNRENIRILHEYYFSVDGIQYRVYGTAHTEDRFLLSDNLEYMIQTFQVILK